MNAKIIFRADASREMGIGHVMRCLTLARELRKRGAVCHFVTRAHPGHQADRIAQEGFQVSLLAAPDGPAPVAPPDHAEWAGVPWNKDLAETRTASDHADWLIVDHYALDARWQQGMADRVGRIMVIDDLVDRPHVADLLLDQNLGRDARDYDSLVPATCRRLIGPKFALLRPEFAKFRSESLARRAKGRLSNLMISMGGVDMVDATSKVLRALQQADFFDNLRICVVMGRAAPAIDRVKELAAKMPWPTEVLVDVSDMAAVMMEADLAIGAAGSTSWERCCMGLPAIIVETANNQAGIAQILSGTGAALDPGQLHDPAFATNLRTKLVQAIKQITVMSKNAGDICDGSGCSSVADRLLEPNFKHEGVA